MQAAPSADAGVVVAAPRPVASVRLAATLRAFASESRLELIRALAGGPRSTQDLSRSLGLSPATVSRHLHVLARAGVVVARRDGCFVFYSLRRAPVATIGRRIERYLELAEAG